ncbi:MAG: Pr6Pr family membrane protein [Naasia sp.]
MTQRSYWFDAPVVRVLRVIVGAGAVVTVIVNMGIVASLPEGLDVAEYFSFFTNLTNLLAGVVFIISGLRTRSRLPRWWDGLRGAVAVYLALTGVVFALLLAGLPSAGTITPWVNAVVHQAMPIIAVVDWLLIPAAVRAVWWRPLAWLAYPIAYLAYTLIRGAFVSWYPYPFLDPTLEGGYARLLTSAGVVVVGFLIGAIILDLVGRLRRGIALRRGGVDREPVGADPARS